MTLKLAALSLALSVGATLVYAQDTIDPKTGKKRGPMEVWRDRDRPNKAPTATPTPTRGWWGFKCRAGRRSSPWPAG